MHVDQQNKPQGSVFSLLSRRLVAVGMVACGLFFMGQFALFTYLRPFLETVTHVSATMLSLMLLTVGVSGFTGTLLIGVVLKRGFYKTLIVIPVLMTGVAILLTHFGYSASVVMPLLGLWGLVATAAPVGWWTWVARTLPDNAEAGGGLMVAIVQLSIALGSTAGGLLFDHSGYQSTFYLSALLLLVAATLTISTSRLDHKHPD